MLAASHGGTVTGLAAIGGLVFAATPVGVFRSSDGGSHWVLPGSAPTVPLASAIAVSPRFEQDRVIFACGADGLYRSRDAGDTWERVLIGEGMLGVATSTAESEHDILVLVGTEADGILRSEDEGRSWTGANAGLVDLTAICLGVSPTFSADRTAFAGTASGLYRTRNGARSWRAVETQLEDPAVQCVLFSPAYAEDHLVIAGTEAHGLLRSIDGGSSWQSPPTLDTGGVTALAYGNGVIAAATERGVALSHDNGESWTVGENGPREPGLSLAFNSDFLLMGLHRGGVMRSRDSGAMWELATDGLSARLDTELAVLDDRTLVVAGPEDGVRVSHDSGATWTACLADTPAYSLATSGDRVWVASSTGLMRSEDGGVTWSAASSFGGPARIVAADSATVVAAVDGGVLQLSRDSGATWRELHTPSEGANIVALAATPDRAVFVATTTATEVTLWRWDDLRGWSRLLEEATTASVRVALAVSSSAQFDEGIFVGTGRRVLRPLRHAQEVRHRERRPMWRSAELGSNVVSVTSLTVSSDGRSVFAATNAGVFASHDGGAAFADWSDGLGNPRVVAIAVSPTFADDRLMYALALGGTVWRRSL